MAIRDKGDASCCRGESEAKGILERALLCHRSCAPQKKRRVQSECVQYRGVWYENAFRVKVAKGVGYRLDAEKFFARIAGP